MNSNKTFNQLNTALAATIPSDSEKYYYFGGTAYLGIPQNRSIIKLFTDGIGKYGLNNGTSRGNNVQLGIYNEAEAYIANRYGAEAALIVSSGYLVAKLTVGAYAKLGEVRYAPNTHPALWLNGAPNVSGNFEEWSAALVKEINCSAKGSWVVISNSMNNLYPEIYDFSFVKDIDPSKNITLIVDDSHGLGMLNGGNSVLASLPKIANVNVVIAASMAKALGIDAGVVLGAKAAINMLKQSDEFYGGSPPAAAGLYAFIKAEDIYRQEFEKLQANINLFISGLKDQENWHFVKDFPVFLCKTPQIDLKLLNHKILISSFPYPDRHGNTLNRIVLASWHSKQDIEYLLKFL